MKNVPNWLVDNISNVRCPHCQATMHEGGVKAIGFRESNRNKKRNVFYFEYACSECKKHSIVELDFISMSDFVLKMIEEMNDEELEALENLENKEEWYLQNKYNENSKYDDEDDEDDEDEDYLEDEDYEDEDYLEDEEEDKDRGSLFKSVPPKSKISDMEVKTFKKFLSNNKFWDDFLVHIGISKEEIENNKIKGVKERQEYKKE